ncbi:hypothetical protein BC940DRAFT_333299 [Gongronella butleri]|nr:hypothetical protein BC940DRAFT_333299 [Gongronella butleri]
MSDKTADKLQDTPPASATLEPDTETAPPVSLPAEETPAGEETNETNEENDEDPGVRTLRDAFPTLDVDIIQAILATHGGNVEQAFDSLLSMSDPNYQPAPSSDGELAKSQQEKDDEALARQLASEYDQQLRQQQQQQQQQDSGFNFEQELPVIKERVMEAGAAAKKKLMGFYNSFMEQSNNNAPGTATSSQQPSAQQSRYQPADRLANDLANVNISDRQPEVEDDAAFARRLALEDAQLERLAAQRRRQEQAGKAPATTSPTNTKTRIEDDEDEQEVTFTTPGHSSAFDSPAKGYNVKDQPLLDEVDKQ